MMEEVELIIKLIKIIELFQVQTISPDFYECRLSFIIKK
jgi:hypothetical protein